MTEPSSSANNPIKRAARALAKQGLRPLPVAPGEKHPYVKWTKYRDSYNYLELASEFTPERGLWTILGTLTGWIVLDCDNDAAVMLWRERLGDAFDKTARVRTRKGLHLWFKVEIGGEPIKGWKHSSDKEAMDRSALFDVQADGQGVMLPPSRHADDASFVYEWEILLEAALDAPEVLLAPPGTGRGTNAAAVRDKATTAKTGRSILSGILAKPPTEGGRNNWHAAIAGHFIKFNIPYLDAYEAIGIALNNTLTKPLDDEEVLDVWRNRWDSEQEERVTELGTIESGLLSGNGTELFTVIKRFIGKADSDEHVMDKGAWANADIVAKGVIDSDALGRTYAVSVQRKDGLVRNDLITPGLLGSANDTNKWLAKHGVSVLVPMGDQGGKLGHVGQRILRYLEWQKPDAYQAVDYLGWHKGIGFVTHEGVITASGMRPHEGVMPSTHLRDLAPYHYGMGDPNEARAVLREVMTYQDPVVCAVFGAWWAATLLKGHIGDTVGHFPYFLINAASEAGKSRGFFALMRTLAGSTKSGIGTRASIRDYIGAHRNGIVHIDDPDDVEQLGELLRAAAGEAIISKKGQDNKTTVETRMVAPILLSGESLGLSEEKAQRDRSISIEVPTPVGRMSTRDATRPQIDDIKDLERAHPDMTEYAGVYVQQALQLGEPMLAQMAELRGAAGRANEVKAIARFGARVLAAMLTGGAGEYDATWIVETVDKWAEERADMGAANTLLTRVLPWALGNDAWRHYNTPIGHPPAYEARGGQIWVSVERLASEWQKECQRRGIRDRLSNEDAIRAQLRAVGCGAGQAQWIVPRKDRESSGVSKRARYTAIPEEYCDLIRGAAPDDKDDSDRGVLERPADDNYGIPSNR